MCRFSFCIQALREILDITEMKVHKIFLFCYAPKTQGPVLKSK